jgi:conjugative relaxase-like TrwC/TraI family protein
MLRIIPNTSADSARSYYSHGDYLAEGQESPGVWRGLAAERLGLSGLIRQADFDALCDNRLPGTDQPLTLRTNTNRTVGYDFNFHVPKSVSLLYALNQDADILTAFRASVNETMAEIEKEALTRVRKNGADELRPTGNLVWGEFVHFTARPVNGEPDPHLHAHCFVFNATHDGVEDASKAGFFGSIKRDAPYFEAYFHAAMARRLADLGYPVEKSGKGWEVRGFEKSTLAKFSRRTNQIESMAAEKGIDDPELKSELGAKSREKKISSLTMPELRERWRGRLDAAELAGLESITRNHLTPDDPDAAAKSLDYAMRHHFERESVVAEKLLLATALKDGVGQIRP